MADPEFPRRKEDNPRCGVKTYYYRPQTKFAKVMFLNASVCRQGVSRPTPRGEVERSGWGKGLQAHIQGWGRLRGLAGGSPGPHPEGCIPACLRQTPPQQMATAGGHILLKTFLFCKIFAKNCMKMEVIGTGGRGTPHLDLPMQTIFQPKCYVST